MKRKNEFDIYAVCEGKIIMVLPEILNGYRSPLGIRVLQLLKDGTVLWYCHLRHTHLQAGDSIKPNMIIGRMGNTGMPKQTHIPLSMLDYISQEDRKLWAWLATYQQDGLPVKLIPDMEIKFTMWSRLERYLNKHLHLMNTPKDNLHSSAALDPRELLLNGVPPTNTKQSVGGGWKATYRDSEGKPYEHMGFDVSGEPRNLITGWDSFTNEFISNFRKSID